MDKLKFLPVLLYFCICSSGFAQVRNLSFYEVKATESAPVIDGHLTELAWKDLPRHSNYYEYAKPEPGPGKLSTSFMMTYDQSGLYMAVVNYEPEMDKIRRNIHTDDDARLWTDDCGEFYFDPDANAIGFTKFTVNSDGVKADMRKLDAAVTLNDWNGAGWQVKTSLNADNWIIEAFFPWEDLHRQPEPGELWMFVHTRYNWGNGFVGVASSPGGGYQAPDKFGYLYFSAPDQELNSQNIAGILTPRAQAPWILAIGNDLISNLGGRTQISDLQWEQQQAKAQFQQILLEIKLLAGNQPLPPQLSEVLQKSREYQTNDLNSYQGIQNLNRQLTDLKWQLLLQKNFQ